MNALPAEDPRSRPLKKLRADIDRLRDGITGTRNAPLPADEIEARVRQGLAAAVARGDAMRSLGHIAKPGPIVLPAFDAETLTWLLEDVLAAAIIARLSEASATAGLPAGERHTALTELHDELVALQLAEEREVLRLEDLGLMPLRRVDVDPAILLEVWAEEDSASPRAIGDDDARRLC